MTASFLSPTNFIHLPRALKTLSALRVTYTIFPSLAAAQTTRAVSGFSQSATPTMSGPILIIAWSFLSYVVVPESLSAKTFCVMFGSSAESRLSRVVILLMKAS